MKLNLKFILDPKFGTTIRSILRLAVVIGSIYGLQLDEAQLVAVYTSFEVILQGLVASPIGDAPIEVQVAAVNKAVAKEQAEADVDVAEAEAGLIAAHVAADAVPAMPADLPVVPDLLPPPPPPPVNKFKPVPVAQPVE